MKILSLGAGVQSTTILLMSIRGELPKLDHAIFADTGWEPKAVYEHLERLKTVCKKAGLPLHIVGNGRLKQDAIEVQVFGGLKSEGQRSVSLPYFTKAPGDLVEGKVRRQCTSEYKIQPITRKIRELLGYKPRQRIPEGAVEQWRGISTDEIQRAKVSDVKWIDVHYPLIIDKRYSRQDCIKWNKENWGYEVPRSACIGCPFHSDHEWRLLRDNSPEEWADAVDFDKKIRKAEGRRADAYLHRSCVPLDQVDLNTAEDEGQLDMWNQECMGMCGV